MQYPSIEQYQRALQHPRQAFPDPQLASGIIPTSSLGLPLVASGGFALTYALKTRGQTFAVRCFHREAPGIERRYAAISAKLKVLSSNYFVKFDFQPAGVRIDRGTYPLVKMAWADGQTLGEFVEENHQDSAKLTNLVNSLSALATYLEAQGISHGDVQEGNLMVADDGRKIQLIDYDGMFVPDIAVLGGTELGHRDYQHPRRSTQHFGPNLDRFSFIALNLTLRALSTKSGLWELSQSGAGVILCRANDFAAPSQSRVLSEISRIPGLEREARSFMAICAAEFRAIPSLADFLAGRNIPNASVHLSTASNQLPGYISQYPVLNAADYDVFHKHIGSMVELVGKVVDVTEKMNKYGRYFFINFAPWRGKTVKITVWSSALKRAKNIPSKKWEGHWITIRGLVEPVFSNPKFGYDHISITAATVSQISQLTEKEALYRLNRTPPQIQSAEAKTSVKNNDTLQALKAVPTSNAKTKPPQSRTAISTATAPLQPTLTPNQLALQRMRQQSGPSLPQAKQVAPTPSASPVMPRQQTRTTAYKPASPMNRTNHALQPKKQGFWKWLFSIFK